MLSNDVGSDITDHLLITTPPSIDIYTTSIRTLYKLKVFKFLNNYTPITKKTLESSELSFRTQELRRKNANTYIPT